jgi:hypothetical protein
MPQKKTPQTPSTTSNPRIQIPRGPELTNAIANLRKRKPGLITESSAAIYAIINYVEMMGDMNSDKYDDPMNKCPFAYDNECHVVDERFRLASLEHGHTILGSDSKLFSSIYDHVHYWYKYDAPFAITMQPYMKANDKQILEFIEYCKEHHLICKIGNRNPIHHEDCLWIEVTRDENYSKSPSKHTEPFWIWLLKQIDDRYKGSYQDLAFTDPTVLDFITDIRSDLGSVQELTLEHLSIAYCCTPKYGWCSGAIYASIVLRDTYTTHWIESCRDYGFITTLRQRQCLTWKVNTQFKRHNVPMRSYGQVGICHASVDFEHENVAIRLSVDKDYHHLSESDSLELIEVLMAIDTCCVDFYSIIYPDYDMLPETALQRWFHNLNCIQPILKKYVDM